MKNTLKNDPSGTPRTLTLTTDRQLNSSPWADQPMLIWKAIDQATVIPGCRLVEFCLIQANRSSCPIAIPGLESQYSMDMRVLVQHVVMISATLQGNRSLKKAMNPC